jgi:hypothetical protein
MLFQLIAYSNEVKLPLNFKKGHLYSEWKINDSIPTKIMLETGFPKIVISKSYAFKHFKNKLEELESPRKIKLWGQNKTMEVNHIIKDSISIEGNIIYINALIADMTDSKAWKQIDMVFPIRYLPGITEINIQNNELIINKHRKNKQTDFLECKAYYDPNLKGLYIKSTLSLYDKENNKEELRGKFLIDLGAPNHLFLNRDNEQSENFVQKVEKFKLKDTTKFKPNHKTKLAILIPDYFKIDKFTCRKAFIVAMRMFGKSSKKYNGIIGNKFLSNFIVQFDFKRNRIYMKVLSNILY